jgi:arylsulfatase A-like enzyme
MNKKLKILIRIIQLTGVILFVHLKIYAQGIKEIEQRPNIIFIITDDQRWDALNYAGNELIHTPNMDKLAEQGIYFKNAFVSTPICAASRASLMTGLYERKHGYTFTKPPLSKELIDKSYFTLLKKAGYYNGYLGKFGVEFESKLDTALFDVYRPYTTDFYYRLTDAGTKHTHLTEIMSERAVDFIKNAPSNKPFCLTVSYNAPHAEDRSPDQYIYPQNTDNLYKDIVIPKPVLGSEIYFNQQANFVKEGLNRVRWYWRFDTEEKYQEMVKGYYRMISGIDSSIGIIRTALKDEGLAENTIIIFISDNGYFLGERQLAGKWLLYDVSLRVPLIIYDPRSDIHKDISTNVLNIDIAPTILEYSGIEIPDSMQGVSLAGFTQQKEDPEINRDAFLCEHLWDREEIPSSEGIRTENYKYFRYREYPDHEELYDLKNDPMEKRNLAGKKRFENKLTELRIRCDIMIEMAE